MHIIINLACSIIVARSETILEMLSEEEHKWDGTHSCIKAFDFWSRHNANNFKKKVNNYRNNTNKPKNKIQQPLAQHQQP